MVMIGLYNGGSMVTERSLAQLAASRFPCVLRQYRFLLICFLCLPFDTDLPPM
jgi:hypothetical protein